MEKFQFTSALLVPMPEKTEGKKLHCAASLTSLSEKVYVFAFNTDKKEEIKPLLAQHIADLKAKDDRTDEDESFLKYEEEIIKMIGVTGFDHQVPKDLVRTLNQFWGTHLLPGDVIYLSWVSGVNRN